MQHKKYDKIFSVWKAETEWIWAISKKFKTVNFPVLNGLLAKKTALLAISISEQVAQ